MTFNAKKFDRWVAEQIDKQLKDFPDSLIEAAKRNQNGAEIVRDIICRALCFRRPVVEQHLKKLGFNF